MRSACPDLQHESRLWQSGCQIIAGLDEVGRGAWAGPVMAAAVALPGKRFDLARTLDGVRDSKQLSAAQRVRWDHRIREIALGVGLGQASHREVDRHGLIVATRLAMQRALEALNLIPQHLIIDYLTLPECDIPQTALVRGDVSVLSIACASIVAKVARDRWMVGLEQQHPGYGFDRHKGYGTAFHRKALKRLGPSPFHRMSYAPVAASGCLQTTGSA